MDKNLIIEEEDNQQEEIPDKSNVDHNSYYDDIVDIWLDLRLYVQDKWLPWLDKREAFSEFLKVCGYHI